MRRMIVNKIGFSVLAVAFAAAPVWADTVNYSTSFTSDDNLTAASATASFSLSGNTLTVVLTNTTTNAYEDSQNLSALSFKLNNFGNSTGLTGSLATIGGNTINETLLSTQAGTPTVTPGGATLAATPWKITPNAGANTDASLKTAGHINYFAAVGDPMHLDAEYSIAPTGNAGPGNTKYTLPTTNCLPNCGTSAEYGSNSIDDPMIYGQATFTYTISGIAGGTLSVEDSSHGCTTNDVCISSLLFGWGPDGPDGSDISNPVWTSTNTGGSGSVPEPSSIALLGSILMVTFVTLRKKFARS